MFAQAKKVSMPIGAINRGDPCTQSFWVVRMLARRCRATAAIFACLFAAACAPTIHFDPPAIPADTAICSWPAPAKIAIAPLDPPPQMPDVDRSLAPCPPGSGFVTCFTADQEAVRQKRFKILHDDRDYCRDAYERAAKRAAQHVVAAP